MKHLCIPFVCLLTFVTNGFSQTYRTDITHVSTSDSVSLYLKVAGNGPICIFIHGGPGAWSLSFEKMGGNILEKHLTMYYYDQRGSGRSASPSDNNYSLERMAEDIDNIRTISRSDKIYLIAHSFGGVLAYEYARRYQQHVRGLILMNATLNLPNSLTNQIEFVNQLIDTHVTITNPDSIMQPFFAAKKLLRDQGLEYKMLSDNKATVEKLDSIDNSIARNHSFASKAIATPTYFADFTSGTADIKIPVLVITGTDDHNIGPNHYKLFRFPNQKVTIINGGHVLYYEKNKAFEKAVIDFVRSIK